MSIGLQDISYDSFINNGIYSYYLSENPSLEEWDKLEVWENFKEVMEGEYNFIDPVPVEEDTEYPANSDEINIDPNYIKKNINDADAISDAMFSGDYESIQDTIDSANTPKESVYEEPEYYEAYRSGDITRDELLDFIQKDEDERARAVEQERWNKYENEKQKYLNEYNEGRTFKMLPNSFDSSEDGFRMKEKYGLLTDNEKVLATLKGYDIGDGEDRATWYNPFELWVSPKGSGKETATERIIPENMQNAVKHGLNISIPGMFHDIWYKDNKYDVPDDYAENQPWSEFFLSSLVSMADPTTLVGFKFFQLGGQVLTRGLQVPVKAAYSKAQPWISSVLGKYYTNAVIKNTPKSKWGYKVADFALRKTPEWITETAIPSITGMSTFMGSLSTLQSMADQRTKSGKYIKGDGNINLWDTTVDMYHGARRGAIWGLGMSVGGTSLSGFARWSSNKMNPIGRGGKVYITYPTHFDPKKGEWAASRIEGLSSDILRRFPDVPSSKFSNSYQYNWSKSTKNIQYNIYKGINKIANSPLAKYGTAGFSMKTAEFAFDSEARATYYDQNENFMWGKWVRDGLTSSGMMMFYNGLYSIPPHIASKIDGTMFRGPRLVKRKDNSFFEELNKNINEAQKFRKYEVNKQRTSDPEELMVNESVKNIKKNTGIDLKVDFVKQHMDKSTDAVNTVEGLLGVHDILTEGHSILMKSAIKDDDGNVIDYNIDKLTDEEIVHIAHIVPTAMKALAGYKQNFHETDEGKQEYIDMYEKENNVKLTEGEKENLIKTLGNDIKRFDLLMAEHNKLAKGINSDSEDIIVSEEQQTSSDIDNLLKKKNVSVVALGEDGKPILDKNNNIQSFQMDKEDAKEHIKNGNVKLEKDVDYDLELGEKASESSSIATGASQGQLATDAIIQAIFKEGEKKGLIGFQKPLRVNVPLTSTELEDAGKLGPNWKANALQGIGIAPWINKFMKSPLNAIKDPYDIAVLNKVLGKKTESTGLQYLKPLNNLLSFSGKKSITQINNEDIYK